MANEWARLTKIKGHKGYYVSGKSGIIYWRGTIKGKTLKISTGEIQISKAKKFMDEYLLSLTSDNLEKAKREQRGIKNPRLSDIWEEIVKERIPTRSATTAVRYATAWKWDIEPFVKGKNVSDVNASFAVAYENWFVTNNQGKVFATGRKYMTMLLNYLHREGYISKKITIKNLDKNNASRKEKHFRVYTDQEQRALIDKAVNERTRLALIFYFDTGARKMEIISRKWSEIDFNKKQIKIWSQKNKEWRIIPITQRLYDNLSSAYGHQSGDHIFSTKSGKSFIPSQLFDKDWNATKRAAGIKGRARVHDIRHTFATKTARDNWPIAVACEILDMTADVYMGTYVHVTPEDMAIHLRRSFG